jgi:hypothetical protein
MIGRSHFARVLAAISDSGAVELLDGLLRPDGKGGRPRQLRLDVFLAAVVIAGQEKPNLSLVNVHRILTGDLARSYRVALGLVRVGPDGNDQVVTLRQVRYLLEAIERKLAYTQGRAPHLAEQDRKHRAAALQRVLDLLVEASVPDSMRHPAAMATDGTAIESWAKGRNRARIDPDADHAPGRDEPTGGPERAEPLEGPRSFDTDAAWGYRTKTYSNRTDRCFGYHAFAMVGVPEVGTDPDSTPKLIHRLAVRPANANAAEPALALLDSLVDAGRPVAELLVDREFSYKRPESWAHELRRRSVSQVIDLHENDRGIYDHDGVAMIDGTPHCSAVLADRDHLVLIPRPVNLSPGHLRPGASEDERRDHEARVAEIAQFRTLIAEREVAAFRRVAGPDADGKERWECPAQAGKVICANCPFSLAYPEGTPVVRTPHRLPPLPDEPARPAPGATTQAKAAYRTAKAEYERQRDYLRCCRQRTITVPGNVTPKTRQRHYWGSDAWIQSYARRAHVEGAFGTLKSPKAGRVERGWIYVVGIVKTSLMLACAVVATNIRVLRTWADRTGDRSHPLCAVDPGTRGFEELDPAGNPDLATAPPDAA